MENKNSYLPRLRILTSNLSGSSVSESSFSRVPDISYLVSCGECVGWRVYHDDSVAIQRAFMKKDTILEQHLHEKITEILIVLSGKVLVTIDDSSNIILTSRQSIYFPPFTLHKVVAIEDTCLIGITIPPEELYP